ncbi:MAG: sodium-dependent transporter, partial [Clostridiales bacterium]|nr:sodium-dependent transporter [Clostridiales bacterium]
LSGLAIMPAVFAYGVDVTRGPSLMFIALPTVFQRMPFGRAFAVFFFISVAFAGITSLINMFEAVTESWQSHFGLGRKTAVLICSAITLAAGLFLEAEPRVGSWLDFITIVVVPIGAVLGAVSIYYVLGWDNIRRELDEGRKKPVSRAFGQTAKLVYVPLTVLILILGFIYKGIG